MLGLIEDRYRLYLGLGQFSGMVLVASGVIWTFFLELFQIFQALLHKPKSQNLVCLMGFLN